ncbi:hypothetical protein EMIT0158MI4_80351 [Burkholderia ambifaria]
MQLLAHPGLTRLKKKCRRVTLRTHDIQTDTIYLSARNQRVSHSARLDNAQSEKRGERRC